LLQSKGDRQKTGNAFLGRAHDSVQSHSSSLMSKIKGLKRSVGVIQEKYQSHVSTMQFVTLNAHHKLISEVRAVLKTLAKVGAQFKFIFKIQFLSRVISMNLVMI